jgi:alcohol dehydrogenase
LIHLAVEGSLADAYSQINPKLLITHHFPLDRILEGYDTFGKAASRQALKVIIET